MATSSVVNRELGVAQRSSDRRREVLTERPRTRAGVRTFPRTHSQAGTLCAGSGAGHRLQAACRAGPQPPLHTGHSALQRLSPTLPAGRAGILTCCFSSQAAPWAGTCLVRAKQTPAKSLWREACRNLTELLPAEWPAGRAGRWLRGVSTACWGAVAKGGQRRQEGQAGAGGALGRQHPRPNPESIPGQWQGPFHGP